MQRLPIALGYYQAKPNGLLQGQAWHSLLFLS